MCQHIPTGVAVPGWSAGTGLCTARLCHPSFSRGSPGSSCQDDTGEPQGYEGAGGAVGVPKTGLHRSRWSTRSSTKPPQCAFTGTRPGPAPRQPQCQPRRDGTEGPPEGRRVHQREHGRGEKLRQHHCSFRPQPRRAEHRAQPASARPPTTANAARRLRRVPSAHAREQGAPTPPALR